MAKETLAKAKERLAKSIGSVLVQIAAGETERDRLYVSVSRDLYEGYTLIGDAAAWLKWAQKTVPGKSPQTLYQYRTAGNVASAIGDVGLATFTALLPLGTFLPLSLSPEKREEMIPVVQGYWSDLSAKAKGEAPDSRETKSLADRKVPKKKGGTTPKSPEEKAKEALDTAKAKAEAAGDTVTITANPTAFASIVTEVGKINRAQSRKYEVPGDVVVAISENALRLAKRHGIDEVLVALTK
jgi:hypothetical protein